MQQPDHQPEALPPMSELTAARIRLQQRMDRGEITFSQAMAELQRVKASAPPVPTKAKG